MAEKDREREMTRGTEFLGAVRYIKKGGLGWGWDVGLETSSDSGAG